MCTQNVILDIHDCVKELGNVVGDTRYKPVRGGTCILYCVWQTETQVETVRFSLASCTRITKRNVSAVF